MALWSVLLSLFVSGAYIALLGASGNARDAAGRARLSGQVIAAANDLETSAVDLEIGERGYLTTGDEAFFRMWTDARGRFAEQAVQMQRLAASGSADQGAQASRIAWDGAAYLRDHSDPVMRAARRDPASVRTAEVISEGRRGVDRLRAEFDRFTVGERKLAAEQDARSAVAARRAVVWALCGLTGLIVLIFISAGYLTRGVIRPIRHASVMAGELARGDFSVRMRETGRTEIGSLACSFNAMARSLARSRNELGRIADEQAALHRVATLVARGGPPRKVFDAVANEMGRLLKADYTAIRRYENGDAATVVGSWSRYDAAECSLPVGSRGSLKGTNVAALVRHTGRSARMTLSEVGNADIAVWTRRHKIRSAVGTPIKVDGRLWGVVVAAWDASAPQAADVEERMSPFAGLIATAIVNVESRAELAASRARVVAASDAARRRIERDLHDGTQQRLITLGLKLRMMEADAPAGDRVLKGQLSESVRDLTEILDELRGISRGIHPMILSRGGLASALKSLARCCAIPVELAVIIDGRLGEQVEVAVYCVVSEALTNATKHASASVVQVDVGVADGMVHLMIRDDGVGGADPGRGSGLVGLKDRVEILGGKLNLTSPPQAGTTLTASIPIETA